MELYCSNHKRLCRRKKKKRNFPLIDFSLGALCSSCPQTDGSASSVPGLSTPSKRRRISDRGLAACSKTQQRAQRGGNRSLPTRNNVTEAGAAPGSPAERGRRDENRAAAGLCWGPGAASSSSHPILWPEATGMS